MHDPERQERIGRLVADARDILAERSLSREALSIIAARLEALAAVRQLWSESEYPSPTEGEREVIYLVSEQSRIGVSLSISALKHPGRRVPPHNHTTWACIAPIEGCEQNFLYDRLDDGRILARRACGKARCSRRTRAHHRIDAG